MLAFLARVGFVPTTLYLQSEHPNHLIKSLDHQDVASGLPDEVAEIYGCFSNY